MLCLIKTGGRIACACATTGSEGTVCAGGESGFAIRKDWYGKPRKTGKVTGSKKPGPPVTSRRPDDSRDSTQAGVCPTSWRASAKEISLGRPPAPGTRGRGGAGGGERGGGRKRKGGSCPGTGEEEPDDEKELVLHDDGDPRPPRPLSLRGRVEAPPGTPLVLPGVLEREEDEGGEERPRDRVEEEEETGDVGGDSGDVTNGKVVGMGLGTAGEPLRLPRPNMIGDLEDCCPSSRSLAVLEEGEAEASREGEEAEGAEESAAEEKAEGSSSLPGTTRSLGVPLAGIGRTTKREAEACCLPSGPSVVGAKEEGGGEDTGVKV